MYGSLYYGNKLFDVSFPKSTCRVQTIKFPIDYFMANISLEL